MHIGILEDDPDQRVLLELWVGSGQHTCHGFGTAAEFTQECVVLGAFYVGQSAIMTEPAAGSR
jgi:Tat protein secretion system quality control protein TatD with DNase activity